MTMESVEGRDWIGNPDGTLVYWQQEADEARVRAAVAERKLADIAKLCDRQDGYGLLVLPEDVRAILADMQFTS